jgi:hypothetical protein
MQGFRMEKRYDFRVLDEFLNPVPGIRRSDFIPGITTEITERKFPIYPKFWNLHIATLFAVWYNKLI